MDRIYDLAVPAAVISDRLAKTLEEIATPTSARRKEQVKLDADELRREERLVQSALDQGDFGRAPCRCLMSEARALRRSKICST